MALAVDPGEGYVIVDLNDAIRATDEWHMGGKWFRMSLGDHDIGKTPARVRVTFRRKASSLSILEGF
jgi:hypothetical protein